MITRRNLLAGMASLLAAPAIVRVDSLMALRGVPLTPKVIPTPFPETYFIQVFEEVNGMVDLVWREVSREVFEIAHGLGSKIEDAIQYNHLLASSELVAGVQHVRESALGMEIYTRDFFVEGSERRLVSCTPPAEVSSPVALAS